MSTWGPHRAPISLAHKGQPLPQAPWCDSCKDDASIDCHDCEQHQHAQEEKRLENLPE